MPAASPAWLTRLETAAPDVVACWRTLDWTQSGLKRLRRAAAARIEGGELDRCRMLHPLVDHLRCGKWPLFVGIHDLMHLEQVARLRETDAGATT